MLLIYFLLIFTNQADPQLGLSQWEMGSRDTSRNEIPYLHPIQEKEFKYISSGFGWRIDPIGGVDSTFHTGLDLVPLTKSAKVFATADGVVKLVNNRKSQSDFGKYILIKHKYGFESFYGHLKRAYVKKGEKVSAGQLIAEVGNTGKRSTGTHLHYEIIYEGVQIDPLFIHHIKF